MKHTTKTGAGPRPQANAGRNKVGNHPRKKHEQATLRESSSLSRVILGTALIAVTAFIVFSPSLGSEFVSWDDYNYIRDNELIKLLTWDNLLHIFNYKTIVMGNYHPLTLLTYMLEYRVAGLNPFIYHFDNLLLHLFNIMLVAVLVWLLTKKQAATLVVTALFAIHPMRVESVVWAAERKDVLYTFFFLVSLILYIYYCRNDRKRILYFILSVACFVFSILAKGQAVVLPLVLFLVDYWFKKPLSVKSVAEKIPYLALSLLSGILAITAQSSSLTTERLMSHSWPERMVIAIFNIGAYVYKLVFPFNLSAFYKYPASEEMYLVYAGAAASIILLAVVAVFFRKNRIVIFGSLFFLFTLSIVSQILPVGNAIIADRYSYIPYFGLFFIAGMLLNLLIEKRPAISKKVVSVVALILIVFSVKSYIQASTWHDNITLWQQAINQDPDNGLAYCNMGRHFLEKDDYPAAIDLFNKSIRNERTFTEVFHAYHNLGVAYAKSGHHSEAVKNFTKSFQLAPLYVEARFSRGLSYTSMGRYDSAISDFTYIITRLDALHVKSYYSRGIAWNKMGMPDSAVADYTKAIKIDPAYVDPYVNRGNILFRRNQNEAAIRDYTSALGINPQDGNTLLNRSFAFFKLNRYKEALDDALKAKSLNAGVDQNYINDLKRLAALK